MNNKFRKVLLEPKKFFTELWQVISWPKVLTLLLLVVFFVNVGIFIYDKRNPIDTTAFSVDKVISPFVNEDGTDLNSAPNLFGTSSITGDGVVTSAPLDVEGIFEKSKAKDGDNLAPIARVSVLTSSIQQSIYTEDTIFLTANDSYDPDGTIQEYRWDFDQSNGNGIDANGVNTTVTYSKAGVYVVTLMVIDDTGLETTTTMSINVAEKPSATPNAVVQGLTTNIIDIDNLGFMSRTAIQQALQTSFADFTSESYALLAQSIYNSKNSDLAALPSLDDIELSVGGDASSQAPVVDSFIPSRGAEVFEEKPVIAVGYYGKNKIDVDSIQLTVDGVNVTSKALISQFGVQYKPDENLGFGTHNVMIVVVDEQGLQTVESFQFEVIDREAENADLVKEYKDEQGPQMLIHSPDANAKNVKTTAEILVKYDEEFDPASLEIAVVDLTTNITKFYTQTSVEIDSTKTQVIVSNLQGLFEFNHAYQIVARQTDLLGNESVHEWYVMAEDYDAPEFQISTPEEGYTSNVPEVTITGFTDPTYQMIVGDGVIANVDMNGSWSAKVSLELGANEIDVIAKDLKGRTSTKSITLNYDPSANEGNPIVVSEKNPVIRDASIRDGQTIDKVRPQISFVFADTDGIDQESIVLKVDGEDVTKLGLISRDSITYKPLEPLEQGEHKIQFIVSDTKGNTTDYNMTFIVDAYPENPTQLVATLTNNNESVLLVWDGVSNIENPEYRVYRSTQPNVNITAGNQIAQGLTTTTYTDHDVVDSVKYYYVVTAANNADHISKASNEASVKVDHTPPPLVITHPVKDFLTQEDFIIMTGSTEADAEVEVFVNFKSVGKPTINSNGTYEIQFDLVEGENVITTVSRDKDGNETIDIRTIIYQVPDLDSPRAVSKSPTGVRAEIDSQIIIKYSEEVNPETLKLTLKRVDNKQNVIPVNLSDIALAISEDGKTVTYTPRKPLDYEAEYSVEVYVEDLAGNQSINDDWTFITKTKAAPKLEVISPIKDFYTEKTDIFVTGLTEPNISIQIKITTTGGETGNPNSIDTPLLYNLKSQADGSFSQLVKLYAYKENIIQVIATDDLGHSSMVVVQGLCSPPDTERPYLSVTAPDSNSIVGTDTIRVTGVTEPEVKVTINVNGQVQHDFDMGGRNTDFNRMIRLDSGHNLIKVIATDKSGNFSMETRTVMFDDIPPLLDVYNPIDGLTTNQSRVDVRGVTDNEITTQVEVIVNNGSATTLTPNTNGMFLTSVTLRVGNNSILIRSRDQFGNRTTVIRSVYHDPVHGVNDADDEVDGASTENEETPTDSTPSTEGGTTNGQSTPPADNGFAGNNENKEEGFGTGSTNNDTTNGTSNGSVDGQSNNTVIDNSTGEMNYTGGDNNGPNSVDLSANLGHGVVTNQKDQQLTGKTEPEANVGVYQNGKEIFDQKSDVSNGKFGGEITLTEGKNVLITTADDASGNRTQDANVVTLDTTPPPTNVLLPKPKTLTNENNITVYGITEKNTDVVITIDGWSSSRRLMSDEYGYFTASIPTGEDGVKNITVKTTDAVKNVMTKVISITVDKTAPKLTLSTIGGNELKLDETYKEGSRPPKRIHVGSLSPMINGSSSELDTTIEVYSLDRLVGSVTNKDERSFYVQAGGNQADVTQLKVKVRDKAGNERDYFITTVLDKEPPVLTFYDPAYVVGASGNSVSIDASGNFTVSGVAKDASMPVTLKMRLNNLGATQTVVANSNGTFSAKFKLTNKGSNVVHVVATDAVGNEVYQTASITYHPNGVVKYSYKILANACLQGHENCAKAYDMGTAQALSQEAKAVLGKDFAININSGIKPGVGQTFDDKAMDLMPTDALYTHINNATKVVTNQMGYGQLSAAGAHALFEGKLTMTPNGQRITAEAISGISGVVTSIISMVTGWF